MTDIAELGIQVESRTAVTARGELEKLVASARTTEAGITSLGKTSATTATEMQKLVNASSGVRDEFTDAAASASVFEASLDEQRAAYENLRMSIDPLYAASMRYAEAIDQIAISQQLGVITSKEAEASFRMAETRFLGVGGSLDTVRRSAFGSAHEMKMLGFQLSQITQQGMATGQWAQSFAIQAGDIGASFGVVGLAIGTVAGVLLPTLINLFSDGTEKAEEFADSLDRITGITDSLTSAQDILGQGMFELIDQYGQYAIRVREAAQALVDLQNAEAQAALSDLIIDNAEALDLFTGRLQSMMSSAEQSWVVIQRLQEQFGITKEEATELRDAFRDLRFSDTFEGQQSALARISDLMRQTGIDASQLPPELRKALIQYNEMTIAGAELEQETRNAAEAAATLAGAGPKAGWLAGAIGDASTLASRLWDAVAAAAAAAAVGGARSDVQGGRGADPRTFEDDPYWKNKFFPAPAAEDSGDGGGGGGGGGEDDFTGRLESLIKELRDERDIETEWYEEGLAILEDRRANELLGEQEHKEALIALEEEYQSRLKQIEMEARQRRISETAGLFGALAEIASVGGKKSAKAVATFQAIEGTINAYGAAIKALNTPGISLAGRFAAYASVLAAGLKGVMAIKQAGGGAGGGGGGGGGRGSESVPRGAEQAAQPAKPVVTTKVLGIRPDDIFTGKLVYEMFAQERDLRGFDRAELIGA